MSGNGLCIFCIACYYLNGPRPHAESMWTVLTFTAQSQATSKYFRTLHLVFSALPECVHVYLLLPCGDAIQADLFICSLICQTRSNAQVTFYRDCLSHCLELLPDPEIFSQTDIEPFYLANIYKAVCAPLPAKTQHALLIKSMNFMQQPLRHLTMR